MVETNEYLTPAGAAAASAAAAAAVAAVAAVVVVAVAAVAAGGNLHLDCYTTRRESITGLLTERADLRTCHIIQTSDF